MEFLIVFWFILGMTVASVDILERFGHKRSIFPTSYKDYNIGLALCLPFLLISILLYYLIKLIVYKPFGSKK